MLSGGRVSDMDKINKIEQMIDEIIKHEGGYVNHPSDRGGPTRWGITQVVARANGYMGSMQDLPVDFARAVYRAEYYTKPRFDQIAALSPVLAQELFDTGVNCGVGFAKPLIQRALNLLNQNGVGGWLDQHGGEQLELGIGCGGQVWFAGLGTQARSV